MNNQSKKKKSKGKIIAIIVCIIVGVSVIGYAAGGGKGNNSGKQTSQPSQSFEGSTSQKSNDTVEPKTDNDSESNDISKVVYDKNGIKITYKGIEDNYNVTTSIKFLVENSNSESYTVQTTDVTIDNYTMSTIMSTTVASGKKANDKISLLNSDLKDNGLSAGTIENAEIGIVIWSESDILNQTKDKITFSLK